MKSVKAAADRVSRYIAKFMSRFAVEASVPALLRRLSKATAQGGRSSFDAKCVETTGDKLNLSKPWLSSYLGPC